MEIQKEIAEAIKKNLPQAVGAELQALLALGDANAESVVNLRNDLQREREARAVLMAERDNLAGKLKIHAELAVREQAVAERERAIDVRELKQELAAERRISVFAVDVVTKLVRNTEFRQSTVGSVPVALPGSPGDMSRGIYPTTPAVVSHPSNSNQTSEAS